MGIAIFEKEKLLAYEYSPLNFKENIGVIGEKTIDGNSENTIIVKEDFAVVIDDESNAGSTNIEKEPLAILFGK